MASIFDVVFEREIVDVAGIESEPAARTERTADARPPNRRHEGRRGAVEKSLAACRWHIEVERRGDMIVGLLEATMAVDVERSHRSRGVIET